MRVLSIIRETDALATVADNGRAHPGRHRARSSSGAALPFVFTGHPTMFGIMFTEHLPDDYRGWADTDHELYDAVAGHMIQRGAMPEPDSREPWFMCEAHAEDDLIDRTLSVFEAALDAALAERTHAGHIGHSGPY